jgi:hypothetical protein
MRKAVSEGDEDGGLISFKKDTDLIDVAGGCPLVHAELVPKIPNGLPVTAQGFRRRFLIAEPKRSLLQAFGLPIAAHSELYITDLGSRDFGHFLFPSRPAQEGQGGNPIFISGRIPMMAREFLPVFKKQRPFMAPHRVSPHRAWGHASHPNGDRLSGKFGVEGQGGSRGLFHAELVTNAEAEEEKENGADDGLEGGQNFERRGEIFKEVGIEKILAEAEDIESISNAQSEGVPRRGRAG